MDPRNTTTIGRSASMSFLLGNLAQDLDLQPERQQQLEGALREIENSLEYRLMLAHDNESEGLHHFDNDSLPSGLRLPDGNGNNSISPFSSPGSDETVKPNARQKTRDGTLSSDSWTHGSSRSLPMNVPQLQHTGQILDLPYNDRSILNPHARTFQPPTRSSANPLSKSSSAPLLSHDTTAGNLGFLANMKQSPSSPREQVYGHVCHAHGYQSDGKTPTRVGSGQESPREQVYQPSGHAHGYQSGEKTSARMVSTQESPLRSLHQRHPSNRTSSIPSVPSRLGPGHLTDDLGSDTSGLVPSPSSASKGQQPAYVLRRDNFRPSLPTTHNRPIRVAYYPNDPFLDHRAEFEPQTRAKTYELGREEGREFGIPKGSQSFGQSERTLQNTLPMMTYSPSRSEMDPIIPSRPRSFAQSSWTSQDIPSSFRATHSPNAHAYMQTPPTTTLLPAPFSAPTLPTVHLPQTPQNRAHLSARLPARQSWILTAAAEIITLHRAYAAAAAQYASQPTSTNFDHWKRTKSALEDATNLDKRAEERRNLFMPQGRRAMRTRWGSEEVDGFAGVCGEGRLLGGEMALLERICLEGGRRSRSVDVNVNVNEVPLRLTTPEKKAVRGHTMGVLREATGRRTCEGVPQTPGQSASRGG